MKILVSNDDGVYAPGLAVLAEALRKDAAEVCVVAPDRNRSGASNALTLDRPLEAYQHTSGILASTVHLLTVFTWVGQVCF